MGVCILGGSNIYLAGDLTLLSDSSSMLASFAPHGDMEGEISILEGSMHIGNGAQIEGSLTILADPVLDNSIIGTSNCLCLAGDLLLPQGELIAGGELTGEFALGESDLTGTVPSIGYIDAEAYLISGSLTAGGELIGTGSFISGSITATVSVTGSVNAQSTLNLLTGSCDAIVPCTCSLTGEFQTITSGLTGHQDTSSSLSGQIAIMSGSVIGSTSANSTMEQTILTLSGYMTGVISSNGVLEDQLALISNSYLQDAETYDYGVLRFIRGQIR